MAEADPGDATVGNSALWRRPRLILLIDHTASMGGGEIALLNLIREIDRRRYEPVVLLFAEGPLVADLRKAGVTTHLLPLDTDIIATRKDELDVRGLLQMGRALQVGGLILNIARFIRTGRYAVVHTNSLKSDIIGGLAGRMAGKIVIWHIRDRIAEDYLPRPAVRLFRALCRLIPHYLIANSKATLDTCQMHGDNAIVVHDGMPDISYPPSGESHGPPLIGLVGRLSPWKGQDVFIRAAAEVLKQFPSARFQIIGSALFGEDAYEKRLREMIATLNLAEAVELTGFRKDVPALISKLDLLVHASTTGEPFGQVVIEGMHAGKPVVATKGGGIPEIVVDGQTGLLVPMNDAPAMAAAICDILGDPDRARHMGLAGRRRVEEHFTIKRTARLVQEVYGRAFESNQGKRY